MSGGRFLCPIDPAHGKLLDWPTDRWAWHCPHRAHDGLGDVAPTRAYFTTSEAETGVVVSLPIPTPTGAGGFVQGTGVSLTLGGVRPGRRRNGHDGAGQTELAL